MVKSIMFCHSTQLNIPLSLFLLYKTTIVFFCFKVKRILFQSKAEYFPQACTCHQIEKKIKEIYTFNRLFNYLQQFLIALGITYSTFEKRLQMLTPFPFLIEP